jgi:hypothetical protein
MYRTFRFPLCGKALPGPMGCGWRSTATWRRCGEPSRTRAASYLEQPYAELLLHALAGNDPNGAPDPTFRGRETGRNAAVIGLALAAGLRLTEFTYLTVFEVPPLPGRRTDVPIPLVLAPPTTKGSKGRATWIDYEALARTHDYITWDRSVTVEGSRWMPDEALST